MGRTWLLVFAIVAAGAAGFALGSIHQDARGVGGLGLVASPALAGDDRSLPTLPPAPSGSLDLGSLGPRALTAKEQEVVDLVEERCTVSGTHLKCR